MKIYPLEVTFKAGDEQKVLYPVILKTEDETILVDCGYEGFSPLIEAALSVYKLSLQDLTGIILTHHDIDHIGALHEIKTRHPSIKLYSSDIEKEYIEGKKKSLRLEQAEALYNCLPEDQKEWAVHFQELHNRIQPVMVDGTLAPDENVEFLKAVKIIATPGHMPGHISIYVGESKTLIAADAIVYEEGVLDIANPQFTLDLPKAIQSIRKLQELEIEKLICYHGGVLEDDIPSMLQKLVDKYSKNQR